ncbi:unnamed protein product [Gongylonema pulchrum]|uniref:Pre-SET domain-containing protein n=1 Tax=Gongylonema pulchrum TaxID=637853 RepID=A0A183CV49_9BILA|nr:unnamed protein product [Gongylonema pulchrum]
MGREPVAIPLENAVGDGATLDADFEYISAVTDCDAFQTHIDFSLACRCTDNCRSNCPCLARCTYDPSGRLNSRALELADRGELGVLLECSSCCFCSSKCKSRVAQRGVHCRLQVIFCMNYLHAYGVHHNNIPCFSFSHCFCVNVRSSNLDQKVLMLEVRNSESTIPNCIRG